MKEIILKIVDNDGFFVFAWLALVALTLLGTFCIHTYAEQHKIAKCYEFAIDRSVCDREFFIKD